MKKLLKIALAMGLMTAMISGCVPEDNTPSTTTQGGTTAANDDTKAADATTTTATPGNFDDSQAILVITREDGSGTRGAFVEIIGIGNDEIVATAEVRNNAGDILGAVEQNDVAISYISAGSVSNAVTALTIEGIAPTTDNIRSGAYAIQRPFNVVHNGSLNADAQDFWNFIFSAEGQAVVVGRGYIEGVMNAPAWEQDTSATGSITVGGSTSVQPLMERLIEAYVAAGGTVTVELQGGGSGVGESSTVDGTFEIGMVSREVRVATLTSGELAIDGIAVIVNKANPLTDISIEDLKDIYLGDLTIWNQVG
ncbi:MAG: substrate-binding domain-containing protein [Oscillospiraceae bacterium]|nr:substrate-binding domain-containing protein [Oscillospiraceae bacterium]